MATSAQNLAKIAAWAGKDGATFAPSPRKSHRWIGRNKGSAFSRCRLVETIPSPGHGVSATLILKHPTRGLKHWKRATPELLQVFYPTLPAKFVAAMLGH